MIDAIANALAGIDWVTDLLVVGATIGLFAFFSSRVMRGSRLWRATVTPLASIIGSGFLVVAPLLGYTVGNWAFAAMLGIVILAYAVGAAVRYNIRHVERISDARQATDLTGALLRWQERVAKIALAAAYVVAVTFYLELLSAFVLQGFDVRDQTLQKLIATALVVFIGAFGYSRGLEQLEALEKYSVNTKLAIIAGFLAALAVVNVREAASGSWALASLPVEWDVDTVRKLLGAFLIVQGFETSRYLGDVYDARERVQTMRYAQLLSAAIYLCFIGLSLVLLGSFDTLSETGIIAFSERVATILPFLLIVGAAAAQFSAAVADTLACGGLVEVASYHRVNHRYVYLAVTALATLLLWTSHIFEIIAYASRAFALYYFIQCAMAALHAARCDANHRMGRVAGFSVLALLMAVTAAFGIPAESVGD